MPRERKAILSSLREKGFTQEDGKDHYILRFEHKGLTRGVFTKVSRGSGFKDYSDNLLAKMCKQLKITRPQLNRLIDCDLDEDGYVNVLKAQDIIRDLPASPK